MGFWTIIQTIIAWGPRVISLLMSLWDLIGKIKDPEVKKTFVQELKAGPGEAKTNALLDLHARVTAYHAALQDGPEPPKAA